jgi:predicted nucleotidyltransferase
MEREQILAALKAHEAEIRSTGVVGISLFGSVARGERPANDVDVAVRLRETFPNPDPDYLRRLEELRPSLYTILSCKVDVIEEPVRKRRLQQEIDRDRVCLLRNPFRSVSPCTCEQAVQTFQKDARAT